MNKLQQWWQTLQTPQRRGVVAVVVFGAIVVVAAIVVGVAVGATHKVAPPTPAALGEGLQLQTKTAALASTPIGGLVTAPPGARKIIADAAKATRKPLPAGFPIDAVFTWVSGDDPEWRATKARIYAELYGKPYGETPRDPARTMDGRDDLYFSVHSLTKFAPWLRRVWIFTAPGHRPSWLKLGTGRGTAASTAVVNGIRVTCVHHDVAFDPACVPGPTFNSNSIEAQIPHIRGIAECFLMCNDDFMTGAPLARGDVFTAAGVPVVTLRDVASRVAAMNTMWGQHLRNLGQLATDLGLRYVLPEHVAAPVRKSALKAVVKALRPAVCGFEPFRTRTNFPVWYMALLVAPSVPRRPGFRTRYFADGTAYVAAMSSSTGAKPVEHPHLFCINQDVHDGAKAVLDALLAS